MSHFVVEVFDDLRTVLHKVRSEQIVSHIFSYLYEREISRYLCDELIARPSSSNQVYSNTRETSKCEAMAQ
jgi:hypothetical protein